MFSGGDEMPKGEGQTIDYEHLDDDSLYADPDNPFDARPRRPE